MYYNCVKFHKNSISNLVGVALTRYMDGRTDGQGDSYIPPQTLFAGGITINEGTNGKRLKKYGKFSTDETFSLL